MAGLHGTHKIFPARAEMRENDEVMLVLSEVDMSEAITGKGQSGLLARLGSALHGTLPSPSKSPGKSGEKPHSTASPASHRHENALTVLTAARGVVQRGWAQNGWYVMRTRTGRRRTIQSIFPSRLDRTQVVEACLVGAVMHAAWQQSAQPEHAYPALDALWHTLLGGDSTGGDSASGEPVGPLCSPPVRVARVRDLTTWNDHRYRTQDEVLRLLDRTVARIAEADSRR
jgi:hypothetical protein